MASTSDRTTPAKRSASVLPDGTGVTASLATIAREAWYKITASVPESAAPVRLRWGEGVYVDGGVGGEATGSVTAARSEGTATTLRRWPKLPVGDRPVF